MANPQHLAVVLEGKDAIQEWRRGAPKYSVLDLSGANLGSINLRDADLSHAVLSGADLTRAILIKANLTWADLTTASLYRANLVASDLKFASLTGADLTQAILTQSDLSFANLTDANLTGVDFGDSVLKLAKLKGANFTSTEFYSTVFSDVDLSRVIGLESASHTGPSHVSTDTLLRSAGAIPDAFLQGCGMQEWEILQSKMYDPTLSPSDIAELQIRISDKRTSGPLYVGGLFISYSRANDLFVDRIYERLKKEGIPVWLDRHDIVAGDLQKQISRAIRLNDIVLLVLSEAAIKSDWVESELDMAREREKAENRDVLCPISIDDAWKSKLENEATGRKLWRKLTDKAILDFSPNADFETQFSKLLRGLKTNYPK